MISNQNSLRALLCSALVCVFASTSFAETLYVGTNGFNGRTRNQATNRATPWRSIQFAVNQAQPGDTVVVLNGTYWENVGINKSGNENNWIKLQAENKHGALLVGSIQAFGRSYWIVEGLRVSNRRPDSPTTKGIFFGFSHHITIRDNRVFGCRGAGISMDQCDWLLLEWNITHHNAFFDEGQHSGISVYQPREWPGGRDAGRPVGITIRNNTSYGNENKVDNVNFGRPTDGNGIVIDDTKNETPPTGNFVTYPRRVLIENNLCYLNGGQGIHCYLSKDVYIRNNTTFKNMFSFDFGGEVSVVASDNIRVYNNILFARGGKNANLQFESSNIWWNYNLLANGPSQGVNNGNRTIYSLPFFKQGSFELESFSPAIGAGLTNFNVFPLDVNGRERVQRGAVDLGANESGE